MKTIKGNNYIFSLAFLLNHSFFNVKECKPWEYCLWGEAKTIDSGYKLKDFIISYLFCNNKNLAVIYFFVL